MTRPWGSKPGSTDVSSQKLWVNRLAPINRISASAVSRTTSPSLCQEWRADEDVLPFNA